MTSDDFDPDAFNAFEAAGWEDQADGYHRFFAPITTRVIDALLDAAEVGGSSRVLDVGTGPGYAAEACAARGATVVGVDVAEEMVQLARRRLPEIAFRRADAERLPFEDASLDAVVGNFVILHLGRPERAVQEFARVLAPGGVVALSTWDAPDRCRLVGVFVDAVARAGAPPPRSVPSGPSFFRFASETEFTKLLTGAALDDVRVRDVSFTHRLPSPRAMWEGLLGGTVRTRAMVLGLPEETQALIRAEFERLTDDYRSDGGLDIPVSATVASARRPRH